MDTHTTVPVHGHSTYEEDPLHQHGHGVTLQSGGHEEHHEKKSVLKKVKAKAKKIKETITGHGHHDDQDHDHHNEHEDDDEEEEEEEEIAKNPEVHGAPMYESAAAREFAKRDDVNLGKPKVVRSEQVGSVQLEEDPHGVAPPANYQTKVADPTGRGGEVDVDPVIRQFGKMEVHVEPEDRDKFPGTGSTKTQTNPPNTQSVPGCLNTSNSNEPTTHHQSSSYTDKISSATCVIADKAISAKNVVASKLGYGGGNDNVTAPDANKDQHHSGGTGTGTGTGTGVTDYGRQIAATVTDKLAPVYGKVAEAGSAVASKIQGTATETHRGTGSHPDTDVNSRGIETHTGAVTDTHPTTGASAGVRIKGYLAEKLKPGEEDKALSEVISDALHKRKGEEDGVDRPMGKVTESEQVARRLGTDTDESGGTGNESPGKSYVNRLKGAMTSWWGKGGETDPSQAIQDNRAHGTLGDQMSGGGVKDEGDGHENVGERKLQGSTS